MASRARLRVALGAAAAILAVGGLALALFNTWKYGTPVNAFHSDPRFFTPGISLPMQVSTAVWIGPAGGVLWYWFIAALCAVGLAAASALDRRRDRRSRLAGVLGIGSLVVATALVARWHSPLGWVGWGPRLLIPPVAGASILALCIGGPTFHRLQRSPKLVRWWSPLLGVSAVLTVLAALPSVGTVVDPSVMQRFFSLLLPNGTATVLEDPVSHYANLLPTLWRALPSQFVTGITALGTPMGVLLSSLLAVAVAVTFAGMRRARHPADGTS